MRIIRPPGSFDRAAGVPRAQWGELLRERRVYCGVHLPQDCRNLVFFVEDGAANDWLGLGSSDRYIREGLGLDPDIVGWALDGLRQLRPDETGTLDRAVVLGQRGRPRKGEGKISNRRIKGGTNIAYTLARLDRDRPDLAERVRAGQLSANAAAIEAGWRGRQNDPLIVLRRAWGRATPEQRAAFLEEVGGP